MVSIFFIPKSNTKHHGTFESVFFVQQTFTQSPIHGLLNLHWFERSFELWIGQSAGVKSGANHDGDDGSHDLGQIPRIPGWQKPTPNQSLIFLDIENP